MDYQPSQPSAGPVRISFAIATARSAPLARTLLGEIVAGLPVAPDEVEVDAAGTGWILYRDDDELTIDELTETVRWLERDPRISEVRWTSMLDP